MASGAERWFNPTTMSVGSTRHLGRKLRLLKRTLSAKKEWIDPITNEFIFQQVANSGKNNPALQAAALRHIARDTCGFTRSASEPGEAQPGSDHRGK
jgi:hypothetical protein